MPNICLQFGQCGSQLGYQLFDCLNDDIRYRTNIFNREFFDTQIETDWFVGYDGNCPLEARAVIVDTEGKVISELQNKLSGKSWRYPRNCAVVSDVGGSGNNWAIGHFENGPKISEQVLENVRLESEKCSHVEGFLALMSSAGGTGSGVGSYVCQILRDAYPKKSFIASLILPNANGEVTVQNYNTIFSISKLYESCDAILNFSNDYLQKICSQVLQLKQAGYDDLNNIISGQLSCLINSNEHANCLSKMLPLMTSHPDFKMLNLKASPYFPEHCRNFETPSKWPAILRHVKMMLAKADESIYDIKPTWQFNSSNKQRVYLYNKCVTNLIACCGNEITQVNHLVDQLFDSDELYVSWVPRADRCFSLQSTRATQGRDKFAVLLSNNGINNDKLQDVVERAWKGFIHQAYTHHFYNHGSTAEDFIYAFSKLESVVASYSSL